MMMRRTAAATLLGALAIALLPAPAQARGTDHISTQDTDPEFCGVLSVEVTEEADLAWISRTTPDGVIAGTVWSDGLVTFRNLANDKVVTLDYRRVDRDIRVFDNGDGIRTIQVMDNRLEVFTGPDGVVLRNRGPVWLEVVVSDNGTPDDFFDDYWVEFLSGRQGGNWDLDEQWCDQMVTWLE